MDTLASMAMKAARQEDTDAVQQASEKVESVISRLCSLVKVQLQEKIALGIRYASLHNEKDLLDRQMRAIQGVWLFFLYLKILKFILKNFSKTFIAQKCFE